MGALPFCSRSRGDTRCISWYSTSRKENQDSGWTQSSLEEEQEKGCDREQAYMGELGELAARLADMALRERPGEPCSQDQRHRDAGHGCMRAGEAR